MFGNHGLDPFGQKSYRWQDILGGYVDGYWANNQMDIWAKCRLNPHNKEANMLYDYVRAKMPVGFSVGGDVSKSFNVKKAMSIEKDYFDNFELLETSPVGIPAYPYAVNKSFGDQLLKQLDSKESGDKEEGGDNMPEEKNDVKTDAPKEGSPKDEPKEVKPKEDDAPKSEPQPEAKIAEEAKEEVEEKVDDKVTLSRDELKEVVADAVKNAFENYKPETKTVTEESSPLKEAEKKKKEMEEKDLGTLGTEFMKESEKKSGMSPI
jgi:hypothetical protein